MNRYTANLLTTRWALNRTFPSTVLDAIEQAVYHSESRHSGQIRFAIETSLDVPALWRGVTARDRAIQAFSDLRIWDTEANCGVLIYLLLAEHDIEIVADRGYTGRVDEAEWLAVCSRMEADFRAGRYESGAVHGVEMVTEIICRHFPPGAGSVNELPNRPIIV